MKRTSFVMAFLTVLSLLSVSILTVLSLRSASIAVAEEVIADDYVQMWMPLVGTWNVTIEVGDVKSEATWVFKLSETKKCFTSHGERGTRPATEGIHGYDPASKKWTVTTFDAEGRVVRDAGTVENMQKGKKLGVGLTVKWKGERSAADGSKTITTSTVTVTEFSQMRMAVVSEDGTDDGKPVPAPLKIVLERVRPAK